VKIADVNVLLYAIDPTAHHHERARRWLTATLSAGEPFGACWPVLTGFLRIVTNAGIYEHALDVDEALDLIDGWLDAPPTTIISATPRHARILRSLLTGAGAAGNLVPDAHLAALAIEHGATLASFDADFHRFSGLKLEYLAAE
jgi:hypothetical protein